VCVVVEGVGKLGSDTTAVRGLGLVEVPARNVKQEERTKRR
jgi:hypothetical protein